MQNSNDYREIPKKIHQILSEIFRISLSKFKILQTFLKIPKKMRRNFAEIFEFRAVQRIAKLKSCRSRKMLKNEYLDAKIGLDTEENEPSKVCRYQHTLPPLGHKYRSVYAGCVLQLHKPPPPLGPASQTCSPPPHPSSDQQSRERARELERELESSRES